MVARSVTRIGIASLLGALAGLVAAPAHAATTCDAATLTCTKGSAALHGAIMTKLPTEIDTGDISKGSATVRAHFTIDPIDGGPLVAVDMPTGAVVNAAWTAAEKGTLTLQPITDAGAAGTLNVHYTLTPSIEATLFGIKITKDATELLQEVPGAKFNYDSQTNAPLVPWGFAGASAIAPKPQLDQSTIFSLPLTTLGLDTSIAEGSLGIQAAAHPTFTYKTKSVQFDSGTVTAPDGSAKIPVGDADSVDVNALVSGDVTLDGDIDVRPVLAVDTIDGFPTFNVAQFSFSAVNKPLGGGAPAPVQFQASRVHIPLPNVKAPATAVGIGDVKAGESIDHSVTITNTGELGAVMRITSSDPQFTVPTGDVRINPKGQYDLKITFNPTADGPASATITIQSNDPDSPEQTFQVGANGADVGDDDPSDPTQATKKKKAPAVAPAATEGCACSSATGSDRGVASGGLALGIALGAALVGRRRRRG